MSVIRTACALCACLCLAPAGQTAESYPNKPIRLILPIAPGGGVDTVARHIGPKISERFGQPVVIDNRPGGGGSIGAELTARAAPDGYTFMMASSAFLIHTVIRKANIRAE